METVDGFDYVQEIKDKAQYICSSCGEQLICKKSLLLHMKMHKNVSIQEKKGDMYVCQKCGKKAKTKQALERHAAYHLDERPFACKMCHQRFKNSDDQGKHYRRLKRDGKFEHACTTCHKHFKSDVLLQKHLVMLGCLSKSVNEDSKELQKESTQLQDDNIAEDKTENHTADVTVISNIICRCKICELNFQSPELLKSHYRQDHGDLKKQVCIQCGQTLSSRDSLSRHYNIFHQEEFPFPCDQCEQKFKIKESLYRHVKFVHTDGGYQCPVCKHMFSQPVNLRKHMSVHTDHKEHICEVCGKGFKWKQALVKHQVLHTNSKSCKGHKRTEKPDIVGAKSYHEPDSSRNGFFSDKTQDLTSSQELLKAKASSNTEKVLNDLTFDNNESDEWEKGDEIISPTELPSKSQKIDISVEGKKFENSLQTKSVDLMVKNDSGTCNLSIDSSDGMETDEVQTELDKTLVETVDTGSLTDGKNAENLRKRKYSDNTTVHMKNNDGKDHYLDNVELFDNRNPGNLYPKNKQRKLKHKEDNENMLSVKMTEKSSQRSFDTFQSTCFEAPYSSYSGKRDIDLIKDKDIKQDSITLSLESCKVVDGEKEINFAAIDVNSPRTRKSNNGNFLELSVEQNKTKEDKKNADNDDKKKLMNGNARSKSDTNLVKHLSAGGNHNSKGIIGKSISRHKSEGDDMETYIDVHGKHLFKPSSLPLILAPVDLTDDTCTNMLNETVDSQNEIIRAERIAEPSPPEVSKNPIIVQRSCCRVTKASVCHSSGCKMQPSGDNKALDLSTTETNQRQVAKTALIMPGDLTSGKFSLIKHMLSLQNEEHFDKSLFENPLYYRVAEIQDFKKLAAMHRISDDVNSEQYDLSAKQNIPLHWLCLSTGKKVERNETKRVEDSNMLENGRGQKSEEQVVDETNRNNRNNTIELYPSSKRNSNIDDHNGTTTTTVECESSYSSSAIVESNLSGYRYPFKSSTVNEIPISLNKVVSTYSPQSSSNGDDSHYSLRMPSTFVNTSESTTKLVSSQMAISSHTDQFQRKYYSNSVSNISSINNGHVFNSDSIGIPYTHSVSSTRSPDMTNDGFSVKSGSSTPLTGQPVNLVKHFQIDTLHNFDCKNGSNSAAIIPSAQSFCLNSFTRDCGTLFSRSVSSPDPAQKGLRDYSVEKTGIKQMLHSVENIPMTSDFVCRPRRMLEKTTLPYGFDKNQEFAQTKSTPIDFNPSSHSQSALDNSSVVSQHLGVNTSNTFSSNVYVQQGCDSHRYQHPSNRHSGHFHSRQSENVTYNGRNLAEPVNKDRNLIQEPDLNLGNFKNTKRNADYYHDNTSSRIPMFKGTPDFTELLNINVKHLGYSSLYRGTNENQEHRSSKIHSGNNQQGFTYDILVNGGTEGREVSGQSAVKRHDSVDFGNERREGISVFELLQVPAASSRFKNFENIEHVLKHCFS